MPKPITSWSNNDNKNPDSWTVQAKNNSAWSNNDVKSSTSWTNNDVKNGSTWNPNTPADQSYEYDSPQITYDSSLYMYDYMKNDNTINQRLVTQWDSSDV